MIKQNFHSIIGAYVYTYMLPTHTMLHIRYRRHSLHLKILAFDAQYLSYTFRCKIGSKMKLNTHRVGIM